MAGYYGTRSYLAVRAAALRKWLKESGRYWTPEARDAFHAGYVAATERAQERHEAGQRYMADLENEIRALREAARQGAAVPAAAQSLSPSSDPAAAIPQAAAGVDTPEREG